MHVHGKVTRLKKNLNLTWKEQTKQKMWRQRFKSIKHDKIETYYISKIKKQKQKGLD